jgi:hypothetical protein
LLVSGIEHAQDLKQPIGTRCFVNVVKQFEIAFIDHQVREFARVRYEASLVKIGGVTVDTLTCSPKTGPLDVRE